MEEIEKTNGKRENIQYYRNLKKGKVSVKVDSIITSIVRFSFLMTKKSKKRLSGTVFSQCVEYERNRSHFPVGNITAGIILQYYIFVL